MTYQFDVTLYELAASRLRWAGHVFWLLGGAVALITRDYPSALFVASIGFVIFAGLGHFEMYKLPKICGDRLVVGADELHFSNAVTGYQVKKSLSDVARVRKRAVLGIPIVSVMFNGNEQLRFICYENSLALINQLKRV